MSKRTDRHRRAARAFTLIEIITVVVIIALLVAITVGALSKSRRAAVRVKQSADMAAISTGLDAYKTDHGTYPQISGGTGINNVENIGFAVLGKELVGVYGDGRLPANANGIAPPDPNDPPTFDGMNTYKPGECVNASAYYLCVRETQEGPPGTGQTVPWVPFNPQDGADGPGHSAGGRKLGPYLQGDKFRMRGCAFLDEDDKPILYFPARGRPNIHIANPNNTPSYVGFGPALDGNPKFHCSDNWFFFTRDSDSLNTNALKRMQSMCGDFSADGKQTNFDGVIQSDESAKANGSYILWAPGPDGLYGPAWNYTKRPPTDEITQNDINKCDDVIFFATQ